MTIRWPIAPLGIALFLVAAKTHGRQIRLERELAGYFEVTFGSQNPVFVETLWRRERWLYWGLVASIGLATIAFRLLAPRFVWRVPVDGGPLLIGVLFLHVLVPLVLAFVTTGIFSLLRFALASRSMSAAHPEDWLSRAAWGSATWWVLTLAMSAALAFLAWRRPT